MTDSLFGKRIVITRAEAQAAPFAEKLIDLGAIPVLFPTIRIDPIPKNRTLQAVLRALHTFDWVIFTSVNGVQITLSEMQARKIPVDALNECQIAAVGEQTAHTLRKAGVRVDLLPDADSSANYSVRGLIHRLCSLEPLIGQHLLYLHGDLAPQTLSEALIEQGAYPSAVPIYRTTINMPSAEAFANLRAGADVLTFASGSAAINFRGALGLEALTIAGGCQVACIGPTTTSEARKLGFNVAITARKHTIDGLIEALLETL